MDYFVGLDVGVEDTALCVVEVEGGAVLQTGVPTDLQAVAQTVKPYRRTLPRAGHEAGARTRNPARPKALLGARERGGIDRDGCLAEAGRVRHKSKSCLAATNTLNL